MHQTSKTISHGQNKLRGIFGPNFTTLPVKVKKNDVKDVLTNGVLKAGTLITEDGKKVTSTAASGDKAAATDAYGVVYQDVDFNNSMSADGVENNATEVVPVFVQGTVYESAVSFSTQKALEKAALKNIIFIK